MAAIQELYKKTREIESLKAEVRELRDMVEVLLGLQNNPKDENTKLVINK